ncbi:hypothetical protein BGZ83_009489 [Gryganskiella cystojenkinii]|nr:hypothetical protein BGZ83_009489 [Gryganskiella cystojenkinii]
MMKIEEVKMIENGVVDDVTMESKQQISKAVNTLQDHMDNLEKQAKLAREGKEKAELALKKSESDKKKAELDLEEALIKLKEKEEIICKNSSALKNGLQVIETLTLALKRAQKSKERIAMACLPAGFLMLLYDVITFREDDRLLLCFSDDKPGAKND